MDGISNHNAIADSDKIAIDPHEEYRRSRRNSLWWSSIAILTLLVLPRDPNITFDLYNTNLKMPSWLVFLALSVTSIFMFFGYLRSYGYLVFKHSKGMVRTSEIDGRFYTQDVESVIEQLKNEIENVKSSIPALTLSREKFSELVLIPIKGFYDSFDPLIKNLVNIQGNVDSVKTRASMDVQFAIDRISSLNYEEFPEEEWFQRCAADASAIVKFLNEIRDKVAIAQNNNRDIPSIVSEMKEIISPERIESYFLKCAKADLEFDNSIKSLNAFKDDFKSLHENINREDRIWIKFYDEVPVKLLFSVCVQLIIVTAIDNFYTHNYCHLSLSGCRAIASPPLM